jgi:galactonate dehydratase
MKITGMKPFLISTDYGTNWVLVKVYTDEGCDGVGEAFSTGKDKTTEAALLEFARWLVGKDPTRIVHNWQAIYRGSRYPLGTATLAALSAVEHALWDITGKSCGMPVYKMLGGACRDRIRVYAGILHLSGESVVEDAKKAVNAGFSALKPDTHPKEYDKLSTNQLFKQSVERVKSVREAIGDEVDLCLEYHGISLSPTEAIRLAGAIEPYHPFFLEEPALTENPDSVAEVKAKTSIPIAAGERCVTRDSMRELIEKRAVDIIQPEPTANGGILQTIRLAGMAEMYHITVAPHQTCSPVSLNVCLHIDACIPNFLIQEFNIVDSQCARDVFSYIPEVENGYLALPEGPGLGIELNEEAATEYSFKPFDRRVIICADGSVGL